jgi:flagellin
VAAYTASNVGGVITITQDTATTGALTAAGSVAQVGGSSTIAVATAADAGTTGIAGVAATALVTVPSTVAAVTAVAAVPATAVMTISGAAIKATDTITMTAGSATFAHTFTTDSLTLTENTAEYVAAWNASADADVSLYTASNVAGVITITEDTATTGNLTVAGSVLQTGVSSDIAVASAAAAGTLGVAGVAEQESYDYSGITLVSGDRVSLTIGTKTYTQEFTTNQATTLNALGALVVNGNASYVSKTVDASGKLVFTGAAEGTALAAATAAVQTSSVSAANSVDDILVTDVASAKAALAVVDSALEMMSDFRAVLGASSNRMFITVDNLMSMSENTSAARSRIVDADFAAESASLAKSQVLQQAGTAMLSQANASTQDILSLLK